MQIPQLIKTSPSANEANVSRTPTIRLTWTLDIDADSVSASSVFLVNTSSREAVALESVAVSAQDIFCTLGDALDEHTTYTVTVMPGISSVLGHPTVSPYMFSFTTGSESTLTAPTLLSPDSEERVDGADLAFDWTSVDGADGYQLQVSTERTFGILSIDATDLSSSSYTPQPGTLVQGTSYFFRARAYAEVNGVTSYSPWSTVRVFLYGVYVTPENNPPTFGTLWAVPSRSFRVLAVTPSSGSINRTPTTIVFTFSTALPTTEELVEPTITALPLYGPPGDDPTGTWESDGTYLTFTPDSAFLQNTVYTITFPDAFCDMTGLFLEDTDAYWFITSFSALYATPAQLQALIDPGRALFTDDQLYRQLFLSSMDVNTARLTSTAEVSDITTAISPVTGAIVRETLVRAAIQLLSAKIAELTIDGNTRQMLGDFSYQETHETISQLRALMLDFVTQLNSRVGMRNSLRSESLVSVATSPNLQPAARTSI